jgi:hypothetical protein
MRTAARYLVTVGIALGGVSVIVAAPAAPPLHDVQVPAVRLSGNTHDNPDATGPSIADLMQFMNPLEGSVVVQNITESETGSVDGDQASNAPALSELLNLGSDPADGTAGQFDKSFDIGPLTPGDLSPAPGSPSAPGR